MSTVVQQTNSDRQGLSGIEIKEEGPLPDSPGFSRHQVGLQKGTIFNIMRFCVNDGPGIRTTVFLKGCALRCLWCHNPEGLTPEKELLYRVDKCIRCGDCLTVCPHQAIVEDRDGFPVTIKEKCNLVGACVNVCCSEARQMVGREVSVAELVDEIEKDVIFYDESGGGVTFSGGEPLFQPEFLEAALRSCKDKDIRTAVDTAGYASPEILRRISKETDLFLYDLKLIDDIAHRRYTGVSNKLILENLRRLLRWQKDVIIRIPVIPGINDDVKNIQETGQFLSTLEHISEVHILPFHEAGIDKYVRLGLDYTMPKTRVLSQEKILNVVENMERFGMKTKIGG